VPYLSGVQGLAMVVEWQLWAANGRLERDARMGVNVRRAVLAGLYNFSEVPTSQCRLKKSAFLIRSPSLYFQFLYNGDCRFESCLVLAAPFEPIIFQAASRFTTHSQE